MTSASPTESASALPVADLAVVGAGPAGLAAAATALAGGLTVVLVDAGHSPGGQFWRQPAPGAQVSGTEGLHHDLPTFAALIATLQRHERAGSLIRLAGHHVWTLEAGDPVTLYAVDRSGRPGTERPRTIRASRLLIATGAYDRPMPFPGWDLPGVLTVGGLQALLKGGGVAAGHRVVVAGTGPFLLPVASGLAERGSRVVVCEAGHPSAWGRHLAAVAALPDKLVEGMGYAAQLVRARVPVHLRTVVVAAHGADRVEAVTLARVDADGRVRPGTERRVEADVVGIGWGFEPQLDLAVTVGCRLRPAAAYGSSVGGQANPSAPAALESPVVWVDDGQWTSVSGVLAAGEVCGVGGAALALREGQLAAESVLADLGLPAATNRDDLRLVRRIVARHRRFAAALQQAHPMRARLLEALPEDTTVCRCEQVRAGAITEAVAQGATDVRQVKQLTRAGMGWCQGRICGPAVHALLAASGGGVPRVPTERLVAAPVPLRVLAGLSEEA